MREAELVRKADLALSDLINDGGYMPPDVAMTFVRKIIDAPTILPQVRRIMMRRPEMKIPKIGFTTRILQAAKNSSTQNSGPYSIGSRAPTRVKPTTSQIAMNTSEVIAEVDLPYEVLEDVIEGGAIDNTQFQQTILALIAQHAAKDLEELLINGDTASGDTYLALQDGLIKRVVSNQVNQGGAGMDPQMFANAVKALPTKYHPFLGSMKFVLYTTKEIDYRMQVAQRQTQLGDALLTGNSPVSILGIPINAAATLPVANGLLLNPKNVLWGIWRDIRMEFDRDVRERIIIIVLTMRVGIQIEEEDMIVLISNIG
jgi:hypothetical protein